jgi:hypothetical protein
MKLHLSSPGLAKEAKRPTLRHCDKFGIGQRMVGPNTATRPAHCDMDRLRPLERNPAQRTDLISSNNQSPRLRPNPLNNHLALSPTHPSRLNISADTYSIQELEFGRSNFQLDTFLFRSFHPDTWVLDCGSSGILRSVTWLRWIVTDA